MDNLITSTKSASDNLRLKLGALFILVFGGLVVGLFAWDIFSTMSASSENVVRPEEVTVIDPKLEADLKRVLEFTGLPTDVDVRDAFRDRADLSGEMARITQTNGGAVTPPTGAPGTGGTATGTTGDGKPAAPPDPVAETRARYQEWLDRSQKGLNVSPLESILSIRDVVPIGFIGGGTQDETIIVYSRILCQTLYLRANAKFSDGWLGVRRGSEVTFVSFDKRTAITKPILSSAPPGDCR